MTLKDSLVQLYDDVPIFLVTQLSALYDVIGNDKGRSASISEDGDLVCYGRGKVCILSRPRDSPHLSSYSQNDYTLIHLVSVSGGGGEGEEEGGGGGEGGGPAEPEGNADEDGALEGGVETAWQKYSASTLVPTLKLKYKQVDWSPRISGSRSCFLSVLTVFPRERLFLFHQKLVNETGWEPVLEIRHPGGLPDAVKSFVWCQAIPFTNAFGLLMVAFGGPQPQLCLYQAAYLDGSLGCVVKCIVQIGRGVDSCDGLAVSGWNLTTHPQTGAAIYFCRFAAFSYKSDRVTMGRIVVDPSQPENVLMVDIAQLPGLANISWIKFSPLADALFVQCSTALCMINLATVNIQPVVVSDKVFSEILISPFAPPIITQQQQQQLDPAKTHPSIIGVTLNGLLVNLANPADACSITSRSSGDWISKPFGAFFKNSLLGRVFHVIHLSYRKDLDRSFDKTLKLVNATFLLGSSHDEVDDNADDANDEKAAQNAKLALQSLLFHPLERIMESPVFSHRWIVQSPHNLVDDAHQIIDHLIRKFQVQSIIPPLLAWFIEQSSNQLTLERQALESISQHSGMGSARFGFRMVTSGYFKFLQITMSILRLLSERSETTRPVLQSVMSRLVADSCFYLHLQHSEEKSIGNGSGGGGELNESSSSSSSSSTTTNNSVGRYWEHLAKYSSFSESPEQLASTLSDQVVTSAVQAHCAACPICQAPISSVSLLLSTGEAPTVVCSQGHSLIFCPLTLRLSEDVRDWYCRSCKTPRSEPFVSNSIYFGNLCLLCGCNYFRDFVPDE